MAIDAASLTVTESPAVASGNVGGQSPQTANDQAATPFGGARAAAAAPAVDPAAVRESVAAINRSLEEARSSLWFLVDEVTGKTVVRVVRKSTGELIRQIPSEEVLAIAAHLQGGETFKSLGVDERS